jgi:hypothetical protein
MSESSASDGIEIECGGNRARLFRKKFKLGSRVVGCIQYNGEFYTPTGFQGLSGRRAAKNWKTSFMCNGRTIGDAIKKGELYHSNDNNCDCECAWCVHCREYSRMATKRKKTEEHELYESPESDTCYDNCQDSSYKPGYAERYVPNKGIGSRKRPRKRARLGEHGVQRTLPTDILLKEDADNEVKDEGSYDKEEKDNGIYFPLCNDMSPADLVPEWSITSVPTLQSLPIGGDNELTEHITVHAVEDMSPPPTVQETLEGKVGDSSDRDATPESVIKVVVQSTAVESYRQINKKQDSQDSEKDRMLCDADADNLKVDTKETEALQCEPMKKEQMENRNPAVALDGDCEEESVVVNLFHAFEDFLDDCEELTNTEKCQLLDCCLSNKRSLGSNRRKVIVNALLTDDNVFDVYKEAYEKEMKCAMTACRG